LILHSTVTRPARRHFLLPKVNSAYTPETLYLCVPSRRSQSYIFKPKITQHDRVSASTKAP
jgi:hypothetical protein